MKKSLILNTLIVLALCFAISSCVGLTPTKKAELQQRTYDAICKDVFQTARIILEEEGFAFATVDKENGILITEAREPYTKGIEQLFSIMHRYSPIKWNVSVRCKGNRTTVTARLFSIERGISSEITRGGLENKYREFFETLEAKLSR
jgi:hypothetical protein